MAGLVPAIHALPCAAPAKQGVHGRDERGHDESGGPDRRLQSARAPEALITAAHLVVSASMNLPKSLPKAVPGAEPSS